MTKTILTTVGYLGLIGILLFVLVRIALPTSEAINYFNFNTAIGIHFSHALVLLMFAFKNQYIRESKLKYIYFFLLGGIIFCCTPLYLIHFTEPKDIIVEVLNIISFIGSGALIGGWVTILYVGFSYKTKKASHKNKHESQLH